VIFFFFGGYFSPFCEKETFCHKLPFLEKEINKKRKKKITTQLK